VNEDLAKRMGVLKVDENHTIVDFVEKPQSKAALHSLRTGHNTPLDYLGSMGIYLFKHQALLNLLKEDPREDFGKHLIPTQIKNGKAAAYIFEGYWEDIGTIDSFYKANIALTHPSPPFNLSCTVHPIHTAYQSLPPPKFANTLIQHSLVCEGADIAAQKVARSIIGPRVRIGKDTVIEESYLFGNDADHKNHPFEIGEGCVIRKALIDKQVRIGNNVKLTNHNGLADYEKDSIYIRDGVIIVTRGAVIPDNFVL
jgi:glucose-1-phosphate adenylyltransferase